MNDLWERVTDWENLLLAYRKARRGKSDRRELQRFALELEYELLAIARSLRERRYEPGLVQRPPVAAFDQDQVLLLISKENLHLHAKVFVFGNIAFIGAAMPRARAHQCFVADR